MCPVSRRDENARQGWGNASGAPEPSRPPAFCLQAPGAVTLVDVPYEAYAENFGE